MVFSLFLGKGSAREIPFFSLKNNKEEQAGVSVSAILSCRPFFILIFLLCIKMKHYGFSRKSIWKNLETFPWSIESRLQLFFSRCLPRSAYHFWWYEFLDVQTGYSVKQAKADVVRDYYGGVAPSQPTTSFPSFTQIAPAMLSEEEFSLAGITITFNSGTTISFKRATPSGVIKMLRDYERKKGDPCIL